MYLLKIVVLSCKCLTRDCYNTNRVLVDIVIQPLGSQSIVARLQRHDARLDVKVTHKLFPNDLNISAGKHVRPAHIFSSFLPRLAPIPFVGEAGEHAGFRGANGRSTIGFGLFRTIPEVMQPLYALELRFFRVGVHIGIGEVPKHAGIVNILRLGLACSAGSLEFSSRALLGDRYPVRAVQRPSGGLLQVPLMRPIKIGTTLGRQQLKRRNLQVLPASSTGDRHPGTLRLLRRGLLRFAQNPPARGVPFVQPIAEQPAGRPRSY